MMNRYYPAVFSAAAALLLTPVAQAEFGYFDGFEGPSTGLLPFNSTVNIVPGGGTIAASEGSNYALIGPGTTSGTQTGAFDTYGANNASFGQGWTAGSDVYINLADTAISAGTYGFDLSVGINDNTGAHAQDNIFHVGVYSPNDDGNYDLVVNGSHNSDFVLNEFKLLNSPLIGSPTYGTFNESGWYTFQVSFTESAVPDSIDILWEVIDEDGITMWSAQNLSNPAQYTASNVGGDRYGWFTYAVTDLGLPVDGTFVTEIPEPASLFLVAAGGFLLLTKRRA